MGKPKAQKRLKLPRRSGAAARGTPRLVPKAAPQQRRRLRRLERGQLPADGAQQRLRGGLVRAGLQQPARRMGSDLFRDPPPKKKRVVVPLAVPVKPKRVPTKKHIRLLFFRLASLFGVVLRKGTNRKTEAICWVFVF